ncbi:LOW QUALITY PROTEIN: uncharacterized protein LOC115731849 [Rhodamnia argentea]|uniref:LOW QUALITY PROTEIN: uncharacterized protein LOC115731849 n=1 Tax=Rhodamnia argentea TaxID=178133 RepID=A0ABM3GSM5_9MYRT|nr:LOW QUALITY PROTEIN: uncharacterized protein LOC115731849 [Rhodamnia argentea]
MALRSLDNALPITPERPKKQAKVAISLLKPPRPLATVNDENRAPLPPPPSGDSAVEYVSSESLAAIPDPASKIHCLIEGLESKDWIQVCDWLNNARRFALYNSDLMLPLLEKVMLVLVKAMKNPRSALCKTSIMAASDFFIAYGDKLLDAANSNALDQMLLQLLLKASQDKRFVCEEADRALSVMVGSLTPLPLLQKLRPYVSHFNLRVRAKAAVSISNCVSKMGLENMKEFGLALLLQMAVELLNDRLPEAREAARSIVVSMYECVTENQDQKQESWQSFCQISLPPAHVQSMIKIVSSQE